MPNKNIQQQVKNLSVVVFFISTLFMVFYSIQAIQSWPSQWAQMVITLACILPALVLTIRNWPSIVQNKKWPVEGKFILIIIILGTLNICFSENRIASFKGMGLFLVSGILVFGVSFFLFKSRQTQKAFLYLCSFSFIALSVYGLFEFTQKMGIPGERILLLSANPIPAGSLLILLSIGPMSLLATSRSNWTRLFWVFSLLTGALLITLIAQRGPALAMIVIVFFIAAAKRKGIFIFTLVALILAGIGYQFIDRIPSQFKNELLRKETLFIRMEFYHIALEVIQEKPIFGLGFNSPLSRFIPSDYEPKIYPIGVDNSFTSMISGVHVFDNMALCFLGETGGFFTMAYIGLGVYLILNILVFRNRHSENYVQILLIIAVLAGFIAHSLTYDSLKYPHLNWLFHSLLALIARNYVTDNGSNTIENHHSEV
jgi:O-antigen ligase